MRFLPLFLLPLAAGCSRPGPEPDPRDMLPPGVHQFGDNDQPATGSLVGQMAVGSPIGSRPSGRRRDPLRHPEPTVPPGRPLLPQYRGVEFRLWEKAGRLAGELVNHTGKELQWTTGGYMIACFALPIGGGPMVVDPQWATFQRPTAWFKTKSFWLPARGKIEFGRPELASRLHLSPGRYRVWQIYYPALEQERWLTSNPVLLTVP